MSTLTIPQTFGRISPGASGTSPPASLSRRRWFEKDILRVGNWRIDGRDWPVTLETLRQLERNFRRAVVNGVRVPVVWNHSTDARDQIGEVVDVWRRGRVLLARFCITDAEAAARLGSANNQVSVEVRQPWLDGRGRRYDVMLTHVGVVQMPVVTNQQSFRLIRLSLLKGAQPMADPTTVVPAEPALQGNPLVPYINALIVGAGLSESISESATDAELESELRRIVETLVQQNVGRSEPVDPNHQVESLKAELASVTRQLSLERNQIKQEKRSRFASSLDRLISDGKVSPSDRAALLDTGESSGYQLSLLAPFDKIPTGSAFPVRRLAAGLATETAPTVSPRPSMDSERARQIAQSFRD